MKTNPYQPRPFLPFYWAREMGGRFQVLLRRSPGADGDEVVLDFLDSGEMAARLAYMRNIYGEKNCAAGGCQANMSVARERKW